MAMNDLATLRSALHDPPPVDLGTPDIGQIMATGRRIRRRRRVFGAATVCGVLAMAVLAAGLWAQRGAPAPRPDAAGQPDAPPQSVAADTPSPGSRAVPVGAVIPTGVTDGDGERVFFVKFLDDAGRSDALVIAAGRRDRAGRIVVDAVTGEITGMDRTPGFRAVLKATPVDGRSVPTFGCFVGPAARIVGTTARGRVEANLAYWSQDSRVVIFWFDLADVRPGTNVKAITAFDRKGKPF
jgi:hypothetical protein